MKKEYDFSKAKKNPYITRGRKKLPRFIADAEKALKDALRKTIEDHARTNDPVVIWKNGKVTWVSAKKLLARKPQPKKISTSYEEGLMERLKDPKYAAKYLTTCLESKEGNSNELFLMALRDTVKAHNFNTVAKKAKLGRENLFKEISNTGNLKLFTLSAILQAVGIRITFESQKAA